MQRNLFIADRLLRTVPGPMWHGDAIGKLLERVSPAQALRHSVPGAHSIWELVLHMQAWAIIAGQRLSFHAQPDPSDAEDWPAVPKSASDEAWAAARAALANAYNELAASAQKLTAQQLDAVVPGRGYSVADMLLGVVEHGAYHGGQIGLLKRALPDRET